LATRAMWRDDHATRDRVCACRAMIDAHEVQA
jgi:hypothetical protein